MTTPDGRYLLSVDATTFRPPPQVEATYATALSKGLPNGVARLDSQGRVLDAAGNPVTSGAAALTGTTVRRNYPSQNAADVPPGTSVTWVVDAGLTEADVVVTGRPGIGADDVVLIVRPQP